MGVYSKVFAARDTHSGATVALKVMNKRGGKWFTTNQAFQNEVAAMSMCSGKGVVQCLARFHTNDDFVIVMPLATEDLFVFLRRHDGKLSEPQAWGIWSKAVATVRSAVDLTVEQRDRLVAAINTRTGREVEVKVVIDPSVLGGVVTEIGDDIIDGSVRRRLNQLRESFR